MRLHILSCLKSVQNIGQIYAKSGAKANENAVFGFGFARTSPIPVVNVERIVKKSVLLSSLAGGLDCLYHTHAVIAAS